MSKHLVQLEIIYKKINEYFRTNPGARSAIFEVSFGEDKGKLRVVKEGNALHIQEGPAAKMLQKQQQTFADSIGQERAALEQEKSALQQQVANIQQAQQPASQLPPPPAPPAAPVGPPSGPPMNSMAAAPMPPAAMPPMPPPMPPAMAPMPPPMPPPAAPMPMPAVAPPPVSAAPPMSAMPPGEGLPPLPAPAPKSPVDPSGDPGSIQLPPGAQDGDINASQAADVVRDLFASEPDAMQRQFGSVNVGNPNVPPDMAVDTEPPREEEAVMQDATITPGGVSIGDAERAFDDTMNRMPFAPNNAPMQAQQALDMAMQVATDPQSPQDTEDALSLMRGLQGVASLDSVGRSNANSLIGASKNKKGKILREQNPETSLAQKEITDEVPFEPSTSEESALLRGLKGQTIQDVSVENDEDSIRISLSLATTDWPVVFEFERGGKVTYVFKNRRYVLLKRWH